MTNLRGPMMAQRLMQGTSAGGGGVPAPFMSAPMAASPSMQPGAGSLGWMGGTGGPRFGGGFAPVYKAPPPVEPPRVYQDPYAIAALTNNGPGG